MPSLVDNAPYTVYECLYAGIPFLASATPSITPMLTSEQEQKEHLFEPKPHDLVRKLVSAVRDGVTSIGGAVTAEKAEQAWISFYSSVASAPAIVPAETSTPLVSVCITHFNRPNLLKQALGSIEAQTYTNYEVILVDDGSDSAEAIRYIQSIEPYFQSKGWTIIRTNNRYLGAARNSAVKAAKGKYVLFLDDDNVAYPTQIATYVDVAETTQAHIFSAVHSIFRGLAAPSEEKVERLSVPLGSSLPVGLFKNSFGDANFFVLREAFVASGGFTEEYGVGLEDHEYFASMIFSGYKLVVIPEPLLYYRMHDEASQMVFTSDPRLGEARRLRPYIRAAANEKETSEGTSRSRRSMFEVVARNSIRPRADCNQTLSAVTPDSGSIAGGTPITIRGSGFSCGIQRITIGTQECSGVAIISNYEISCVTPAGSQADVSLDITAVVGGVSVTLYSAFRYTPLSAPFMQWCKLQDTGVTINCYFDVPTNQQSSDCGALFTSETIALLGSGPTCHWVTASTVAIELGVNATITFVDKVTVKAAAVSSQGAGGIPNVANSVVLQKPDNAVSPVASLSTPTNIGSCEGIVLDGSASTGGAGRPITLTWSLVSITPASASATSAIQALLDSANTAQSYRVEIPDSTVVVGSSYSFSFRVVNWLEKSDDATTSVTKQDVAVPQVAISGPSVIQTFRNTPLSLQGSVTGSACGEQVSDASYSYSWSVTPEITLDASTRNTATLSVPADVLTAGTSYKFTLTASNAAHTDVQNSASVTVVVGLRSIIATISGGNQQYNTGDVIELDASASSDPDNIAPLVYTWSCASFFDASVPCKASVGSTAKITVEASTLGQGKWTFNLRVSSQSNNARYADASAYAEVADSITLSVSIQALGTSTVDPTQKLSLVAVLNSASVPTSEVEWNWSLEAGSLADPSTAYGSSLQSSTLVINADALSYGTSYSFKVVATHTLSGTTGSATVSFVVDSAPAAGEFRCPSVSGDLDTTFTYQFGSSWSSASGITGYALYFLPTDGSLEIPLVESSASTKVTTRLPAGSIKVVGYVYSGSGIAARKECTASLSTTDISALANQAADSSISLYDVARIAYSGRAAYKAKKNDNAMLELRQNLLDRLSGMTGVNSQNGATAAIGTLIVITDPNLGTLPLNSGLTTAISLLDSLVSAQAGLTLNSQVLGANVEVLGNIVNQLNKQLEANTKSKRDLEAIENADQYWAAFQSVASLAPKIAAMYMSSASDGEKPLVISRDGLAVGVYKVAGSTADAQGVSIGIDNLPTISLPAGFVPSDYTGSSMQFVYIGMNGSPYPLDDGVTLASPVVMLKSTANGNDVTFSDMEAPVRVSVPMSTSDLKKMQCMYRNESVWSVDGCTTETSGKTVTCTCNQVATMAVMRIDNGDGQKKDSSSGLSGTWIGVIAAGAGVIVAAVLVGIFVVKRRRSLQARGPAPPRPDAPAPTATEPAAPAGPVANPEAIAAAVATAAALSDAASSDGQPSPWRQAADLESEGAWRTRTSSIASSASSPASSMRSGCTRTASSSSEEEIMESEIKNIAAELNKQLPRDTRSLEDIVNRMDME